MHRSVDTALQTFENEHAFIRVAGVRQKVQICFAKFQHSDTREQDMDLHVHSLIFNLGQASDGTVRTLNSKEFYSQIHKLGGIFRQQLQYEMEQLDYKTYEKRLTKGASFEIAGVSQDLIDRFSKRTAQIDAEVEKNPELSRQQANLNTRKTKEKKIDRKVSFERWSKECRELGFEIEKVRDQKNKEEEIDKKAIASKALTALHSKEKFQAISEADITRQVYRHASGKLSNEETKELVSQVKKENLQEIGSHAERFERRSPHIRAKREHASPVRDAVLSRSPKQEPSSESKNRLYTLNQAGRKIVEKDSAYSILHSKLAKPLQKILPQPKHELSRGFKQKQYEKSLKKFEQRQKSFKRKMFFAYMTGKISRSQYVKIKGDKEKSQSKLMVNLKWLFTNKLSKRQRDYLIRKVDQNRDKEIKATRETEKELKIGRFTGKVERVHTAEIKKDHDRDRGR